jgi:hypothetical protein
MSKGISRLSTFDCSMELEQVYWRFFTKFEDLDVPRSVAEARINRDEIEELQSWFNIQYGRPRNWCDRTWQESVEGTHTASSREMFGALFLILASEISRDHCSEESLWPGIAEGFKTNKTAHSFLFGNGHPTELCKVAMAAGARKLQLRNLIDRSGKQEYFDTIKLQIGFTINGALRRLPDWLDGLGPTTAVQMLIGMDPTSEDFNTASPSFQRLWTTLREFRAGQISQFAASQRLYESPWVRAAWISQLLEAAKLHRPRRVSTSGSEASYGSEPLFEPVFNWDYTSKPCFQLRLNEERVAELLMGRNTAVFTVDGVVVDRWSMDASGSFRGSRLLACQKAGQLSNLRPQSLSISCNGEPIETLDFSTFGFDDPFLIFDLGTGRRVDANEILRPNRDYALVCDPDLNVADVTFVKGKGRSAYRLGRPLTETTQLKCGEDMIWAPQVSTLGTQRPLRITLGSGIQTTVKIGSPIQFVATGVPEDAEAVTLFVGSNATKFIPTGDGWATANAIPISLDILTGSIRLRVRVEGAHYKRAVLPKLKFDVSGVAILQAGIENVRPPTWQMPKNGRLNRASGDGWARIFDGGDFKLREGSRLIGTKRSNTIELRDLNAWGGALCAEFDGIGDRTIVHVVEDSGCLELYLPALFGSGSHRLYLRSPILPTVGHAIFIWQDVEEVPTVVRADKIQVEVDGFSWRFVVGGPALLIAVAYEGICLGAYWNPDYVVSRLTKPISPETIALFRWLRVPLLAEPFFEPLRRFVRQSATIFLRGWLDESFLRKPSIHRTAESGVDTVVRSLLWDYSEVRTKQLHELVSALQSRFSHEPAASPMENFRKTLLLLGELCPAFAYAMARVDSHDERYRQSILSVIHAVAGLDQPTAAQLRSALGDMTRDCAKLVHITPDALSTLSRHYEAFLAGKQSRFEDVILLNRIAEHRRGREFLIATLLVYCLERTKQ